MTTNAKQTVSSILREEWVLVSYHGGYYNWVRRDRAASREYSTAKTNSPNSFTNYKNLFVGCDGILASIKSLINEARSYHNNITLPWEKSGRGGEALLNNSMIKVYMENFVAFKTRLDGLLTALRTEWGTMQENAKATLGSAYNASDYPNVEEVASACYIQNHYHPIPDAYDVRADGGNVQPEVLDAIRLDIQTQTEGAYNAAIKAGWERLIELVESAKDNLSKTKGSDGRFRLEWYDSLTTLLPIIESFNVAKSPDLTRFAKMAEDLINGYDREELKEDEYSRQEAADKANSIFDQMSSFYGSMAK